MKNIQGQRFGMLTVLRFDGTQKMTKGRAARWACRCDCGQETKALGYTLISGNTHSCGCQKRLAAAKRCRTHGHAKRGRRIPEYVAWNNMKQRCLNVNSTHYRLYGGRGIRVCGRWLFGDRRQNGFSCFLADMGPKPTPAHSVDRKDTNGDYEPSNCRWATQSAQVRNSSKATVIQYNGERMSIIEAAERFGIAYGALRSRLRYGWTVKDAIEKPSTEPLTIAVNGTHLTIPELERISAVGWYGVKKRLLRGWTVDRAISEPPQKTGPKPRPDK